MEQAYGLGGWRGSELGGLPVELLNCRAGSIAGLGGNVDAHDRHGLTLQ